MKGRIAEIFASVQGEGVYAGQRQIFVRFSGCNLSCAYCDTDFNVFEEYEPDALYSKIGAFGRNFHSVSFTGGEPLLQDDFLAQVLRLVKGNGYKTYLETNGTLPESLSSLIDNADIIAMDIKLSSSGGHQDFWQAHREFLTIARKKDVFIKAVVCASTADADVMAMYDMLKQMHYSGIVVLQPNSFEIDKLNGRLARFKKYGKDYPFHICIIPQMHKIMGVR